MPEPDRLRRVARVAGDRRAKRLKPARAAVDAGAVETFARISGLLQLAVCIAVGGRLLWLARRTRRLPELAIGVSFYAQALLGSPLLLLSGLSGPRVDGVSLPLAAAGHAFLALGAGMMNLFTWQLFRRGSAAGLALAAGFTLAVAVQGVGAIDALARAPGAARPDEVVHAWTTLLVLGNLGSLAWVGIESLAYFAQLQRRLAFGLADPVVANRFLLWALYGLSGTAIMLVHVGLHFGGMNNLAHPLAQLSAGLGGLACSAAAYLAFLPPARYESWIRARARA